jgi:hypothetical protein
MNEAIRIYMVSLIPDNNRHKTYRYIVIGVDNKLASITYCLRNRSGLINGDYSVASVKLPILSASNVGNIKMVNIP